MQYAMIKYKIEYPTKRRKITM
ncbi:unnamed protein product [Debaryomyces tyrocola]|nr:unnamed protein product [Debaryomyces tyrocola]